MVETIKAALKESLVKTDAVSVSEANQASTVVAKATAADPALINELNLEPWWQSGVGLFGAGGVLWALGTILTQVAQHGMDYSHYNSGLMVSAVGSLLSFLMVLYRRFWPGLRPMFQWIR